MYLFCFQYLSISVSVFVSHSSFIHFIFKSMLIKFIFRSLLSTCRKMNARPAFKMQNSKRFQTKIVAKKNAASVFKQNHCSVRKVCDKILVDGAFFKVVKKCRSQILFSLEWNIIGCYSENNTNDSTPGNSRCNPLLLFKVFFQGAVYLRVFTMCTSIGDTPPHLSPYFSWKGLAFVLFLYLWYTLVIYHVCTLWFGNCTSL